MVVEQTKAFVERQSLTTLSLPLDLPMLLLTNVFLWLLQRQYTACFGANDV